MTLGTAANVLEPCRPRHTDPGVPATAWVTVVGGQHTAVAHGRVPWEGARRARVLMLSDLVKSRVTALLPGREEGGVKGICFPSNTPTSNHPSTYSSIGTGKLTASWFS